MSSPKFPTRRFASAGATKDERDQMVAEFDRSDLGVQESMVDYFRTQSSGGLREYVDNWRNLRATPIAAQTAPDAPSSDADPVVADPPDVDPDDDAGLMGPQDDDADEDDDPGDSTADDTD